VETAVLRFAAGLLAGAFLVAIGSPLLLHVTAQGTAPLDAATIRGKPNKINIG
jgi:hypothetical protein